MVKCKECNGNLTFSESSIHGLGFKLVINCTNCEPRYINSCPLIKNVYEINRRIIFAMRILDVGYNGIQKFCGIMDLPKIFSKKVYYDVVYNVLCASKAVADLLFSEAIAKEKELTKNAENVAEPRGLIVSGDGTWRKRGFSSLQGVTTLIDHYSGKVLDLLVKCSYCKQCEYWKPQTPWNTRYGWNLMQTNAVRITLEVPEKWRWTRLSKCSQDQKNYTTLDILHILVTATVKPLKAL